MPFVKIGVNGIISFDSPPNRTQTQKDQSVDPPLYVTSPPHLLIMFYECFLLLLFCDFRRYPHGRA